MAYCMARQEGIEPPTHSLEGCCSIQLSYWRFIRDRPAPLASSCQVGAPGFEPGTSCSQSRRDTRLRYAPHENQTIAGAKETVNSFTPFPYAREPIVALSTPRRRSSANNAANARPR